jgi:hypothetical protein
VDNLEARIKTWDEKHTIPLQGTSNPEPFRLTPNWTNLYNKLVVLEIGPGEGRQTNVLKPYSSEYYIADISLEVVKKHNVTGSFLLDGWDNKLDVVFETICFWYLIHHVKLDEKDDFFNFILRHLVEGGNLHFNYPEGVLHSRGTGDGIGTTSWSKEIIQECLEKHGFIFGPTYKGNHPNNNVISGTKLTKKGLAK